MPIFADQREERWWEVAFKLKDGRTITYEIYTKGVMVYAYHMEAAQADREMIHMDEVALADREIPKERIVSRPFNRSGVLVERPDGTREYYGKAVLAEEFTMRPIAEPTRREPW
jgi:hypothetical protein